MAKRGNIIDNMRVSKAGEKKVPRAPGEMKTTAINIPVDTWTMLRAVAFARAQETGERWCRFGWNRVCAHGTKKRNRACIGVSKRERTAQS